MQIVSFPRQEKKTHLKQSVSGTGKIGRQKMSLFPQKNKVCFSGNGENWAKRMPLFPKKKPAFCGGIGENWE